MDWFRLYHDLIFDPKVIQFPPDVRWFYIGFLCVSSKETDRGTLPTVEHLALSLRIRESKVRSLLAMFKKAGLIDENDTTKALTIHGWDERQRKSDDAASRMSRIRSEQRSTGCSEHVRPKTEPRVRATEQIQRREEQRESASAPAPAPEAPREIIPIAPSLAPKPDPEWEPQPLPDESMTGRSGKDQADFIRAVQILDGHQSTRRLGMQLRMSCDTPGVQMLRGWQLVVGAMTCQRPDKLVTWGALAGYARNATETQFDQCNTQAPARTALAASLPRLTDEELRAQTEEGNRKMAEYRRRNQQ